MNKQKQIFIALIAMLCLVSSGIAQNEARLLRFPDIHQDKVVFTYGGDLYTVNLPGGTARKLTSHNGFELFAHFSPDGITIAFTGQYDGNTEVFTIPADGGIPKRITVTATLGRDDVGDRMGPNNIVMGWTPDGKDIIFRSRKQSFNAFKGMLFKVAADGGIPEQLPFSVAGFNTFSPDGQKIAFNRVFREFRTWKYYQGGMADDIRVFDFKTKKTINITNNKAQDIFPMWTGDKIYFLSDRDRIMNLFEYNTGTEAIRKISTFKDYDIKFPAIGPNSIIFEKGGYLFRFDLSTEEIVKIPVSIRNDFIIARNEIKDASDRLSNISLSPKGNRLVISARGDIFNVPAEKGITRNLTQTSGVHDRNAEWSPDGKTIAFISDQSGEFEIHLSDASDNNDTKQLTRNSNTYIFGFQWSPNSEKIIYHDKKFRLWMIDLENGKKIKIDESGFGTIGTYSWSPDSKWISYINPEQGMNRISLYSLDKKETTIITDSWYGSGNPVFSKNGKYLFFVSARDFSPTYSRTEWNHIYQDMNKLYLITLAADTKNPLGYKDARVDMPVDDKKEADSSEEKIKDIRIDLDNIGNRIIGLPVPAGNYFGLEAIDDKIFYIFMNSSSGGTKLKSFSLKSGKETSHGSGFNFGLTNDGKKMLLVKGKNMSLIPIPSGDVKMGDLIDLSNLKVNINKQEEWAQIFEESWRQMRDFFYDPDMHGVNWRAIHDKYEPLVEHVRHRSDLSYIIGEMIGELNVGHAYVNNGERPMPLRLSTGLLGASISKDDSGFFRIDDILKGANWSASLRSPLKEIGMDINPGDLIMAINGNSTKDIDNLYSLLIGQAGKTIELTTAPAGDVKSKINTLVKPISNESALYYYKWVQENIRKVNAATNGEVGYIHIPDMGVNGLNEFVKHYYPQLTKKALIIDDRGNGGGNVSPMIIERLMREITYATMHTNQKSGSVNPVGTMAGPKVALIDQYSASDGDLFPYRFKYHKLGTTIGTRTWGGVVGYSGSIPCIDGGSIITPSYGPYAADGSEFIIEGYGVEPDIYIDNEPYDEFIGIDKQLEKAIEVILEELKTYKKTVQAIPDFPKKIK